VLARIALRFGGQDHAVHLLAAGELIKAPDPYLHAVGLLFRAFVHENQGDVVEFTADALGAYTFFEVMSDHWGMGMAAQAVGRSRAAGQDPGTDQWLTLAVQHLELVGAAQDAHTLLVFRDMHRALSGSLEAAGSVFRAPVANVFDAPALLVIMRWQHVFRSITSRASRPMAGGGRSRPPDHPHGLRLPFPPKPYSPW